ncbi:MAG: tRNA dihydrouridine synthase DusB [Bdellovibrionales bacterium]|nr:tRNA dihydrouridine synthase DusB [Bdellovibrionales bacterium]
MTEVALLKFLRENPFVLAPMAGITDNAFRSFMRELGCGIVVSELVSATGLFFNSGRTRDLMKFESSQHPVGIQLFGENPEHLASAAKEVEARGADFVDLNLGCPVPKVVKKGAGSALLREPLRLAAILRVLKGSVKIPVTIKIRTGWDEGSRNAEEIVRLAHEEGVTWVAIHGRTRAAGYSGAADWDYMSRVQQAADLPIIGNGDIRSGAQAVDRLRTSGCAAVMIGRGCLKNPWIFRQATALWKGQLDEGPKDFPRLLTQLRAHYEKDASERVTNIQLKKFSAWFSAGYPNSAQFRRGLFAATDLDEVLRLASEYFLSVQDLVQGDTSAEPFLMGGHG